MSNAIDLASLKVITQSDVEEALRSGWSAKELRVAACTILTPSALEALQAKGITLHKGGVASSPAAAAPDTPANRLFFSAEAEAIKKEICAIGKKGEAAPAPTAAPAPKAPATAVPAIPEKSDVSCIPAAPGSGPSPAGAYPLRTCSSAPPHRPRCTSPALCCCLPS